MIFTEAAISRIPTELKNRAQWICWRATPNGKTPVNALTGGTASVTDSTTWSPFITAVRAARDYDGVGYVFTPNDLYCGIDLDNCRDVVTGVVDSWAFDILRTIDNYTEVSPSGKGFHIFMKGRPVGSLRQQLDGLGRRNRSYYFTVTGDHYPGTPDTILPGEERLENIRPGDQQEVISVLDDGYVSFVDCWGSDEAIIEAARMSTGKGFEGWEKDEKLLAFLHNNRHSTPFEMCGLTIEVKAPIFVFREWHRHRTQCLGPDTLVHFDAPKSRSNRHFVYKMRIEDVWKKWQPTVRKNRPERQVNALWPRSRIQAMQLRCFNEGAEEFQYTRIVDVIRGEPKPMVRVSTVSGRELTATREHRVYTNHGWMPLGQAIDQYALLALEGTTRALSTAWEIPLPDPDHEAWRPVTGWEGFYEVSDGGRVRRVGCAPKKTIVGRPGYPVVGLNRPGEQQSRTVHTLVLEAFCGPRPDGCEARHGNHNRLDARLCNLSWGTSKDNSADMTRADRQQRLVSVFEEIVGVADVGMQPTFDLSVEGPWHNFVGDGFVVHNSYNEMSARYIPLPDENYLPDIERILTGANTATTNKQAQGSGTQLDYSGASEWREELRDLYVHAQRVYERGIAAGVPKELARLAMPVARYSRMRASANLRNWLAFLTLRQAPNAQWEIRAYANAVGVLIAKRFPRTWELFSK